MVQISIFGTLNIQIIMSCVFALIFSWNTEIFFTKQQILIVVMFVHHGELFKDNQICFWKGFKFTTKTCKWSRGGNRKVRTNQFCIHVFYNQVNKLFGILLEYFLNKLLELGKRFLICVKQVTLKTSFIFLYSWKIWTQ